MLRLAGLSPVAVVALSTTLLLAACGGEAPQAGPGAEKPPTPVTVLTVRSETVPLSSELPGRTVPYRVAEVRPQVSGIVQARLFQEGSEVKAGQALYRIDPAVYRAALESAKASLARAEANQEAARLKAARSAELVKIDAVSKQADDEAQAAAKQAQAEVAAARAALDRASLDLDYTQLKAPIAGRIGRSSVTAGALVTANQAAALATIQELDPIYVDVTQSSAELLRLRKDVEAGKLRQGKGKSVPVRLVLEDGSEYALPGKLAFAEVAVDASTGTVTLRAVFPNPKGELLPGMYVRARLDQGELADAILLPAAALGRTPRGEAMVMRVNADNVVEARIVEASRTHGERWVVRSGLAAGDRVIVEGLQRVRPGAPVQAQEAGAAPAQAPAPAGAQPGPAAAAAAAKPAR